MRHLITLLLAMLLAACANPPLPPDNPKLAWVDLYTQFGRLVMADKLDGKRLDDGRYFQVEPGAHELGVRFDYDITYGGMRWADPITRTCFMRVRYADFKAGEHYRAEGWVLGTDVEIRLQDSSGKIVARSDDGPMMCL